VIDAVRRRTSPAPPKPAPRAPAPEAQRITRIKPSNRFFSLDIRELWRYRELGAILAWRDVKVRYKQTFLGFTWALLVPLLTMVVLTLVFNKAAHIGGEYGVPYQLWAYAGILPWTYFTSCLAQSASSVTSNSPLVTKVYFPRLLIPLASVISPVVDFVAATVVLACLFGYYQRTPHWHTVAAPAFMLLALATALGIGLWLSALSVRYRDVPYTIPFLIQLVFFLSPVAYPVQNLPSTIRELVALNPMTGVIDGIRWTVLGSGLPHYTIFAEGAAMGGLILLSGIVFFRHTERQFADVI
jgi:lipopolysaccharide transport system permease protein